MENLNFDLKALREYLKSKPEYTNIALQFDENLTNKSIEILNKLKDFFPDRFIFIVGESCYGECCADEIAALHLNANIIVRIGDSCLTRNKQLPVYFLFNNVELEKERIKEKLSNLYTEEGEGRLLVFYNQKYTKSFQILQEDKNIFNNGKIKISVIAYKPETYEDLNEIKDYLLCSRIFKKFKEINSKDIIVYFGEEQDKILSELCLRYVNHNLIYLINQDFAVNQITSQLVNKIYYKRFNLIQKAKESKVFGIIVGSLSIKGLNQVIEEVKATLKSQSKKFYIFLLGKITPEKLSNFVEYIDCFILIACPFSDFYDFKTLMKPLVSPLDISIAFNEEKFKWDMTYSFDPNYIIGKAPINDDKSCGHVFEEKQQSDYGINSKFTGLKLKESEMNQALANIFSFKTLENYDKLKYKGLDVHESNVPIEKFKLGKTGIPIKYENIKDI